MRDRRYVEDLTLDELEQVLYVRRREERQARLRRMGKTQPAARAVVSDEGSLAPAIPAAFAQEICPRPRSYVFLTNRRWLDGDDVSALQRCFRGAGLLRQRDGPLHSAQGFAA